MKNNNSKGMSFFGVLTIVFIVLKLVGVISWSWLWVLSPFWMPICLGVAIILIGVILDLIKGEL